MAAHFFFVVERILGLRLGAGSRLEGGGGGAATFEEGEDGCTRNMNTCCCDTIRNTE